MMTILHYQMLCKYNFNFGTVHSFDLQPQYGISFVSRLLYTQTVSHSIVFQTNYYLLITPGFYKLSLICNRYGNVSAHLRIQQRNLYTLLANFVVF